MGHASKGGGVKHRIFSFQNVHIKSTFLPPPVLNLVCYSFLPPPPPTLDPVHIICITNTQPVFKNKVPDFR